MNLLICTPVFDNTVPVQYLSSFLKSIPMMLEHGIQFTLMTETRNLISVSRNRCAHKALEGNFDKLLFIDSDIVWEPEYIVMLARSKHPIVGGSYPYRTLTPKLNLQALKEHGEHWNFNEFVAKHADENGEVEVQKLPTGFLMIDVSVFKNLIPIAKDYLWQDPMLKEPNKEKDFFPIGISDDGRMNTEDWGFCELAQKAGYKIYWNTGVICDHIGNHQFTLKG